MKNLSAQSIPYIFLLIIYLVSIVTASSASSNSNNIIPESKGHNLLQDLRMTTSKTMAYKHAVFSDVDGTLVHYPKSLQQGGAIADSNVHTDDSDMIYLPPSKTGTRGVISARTLKLCSQIRHGKTTSEYETKTSSIPSKKERISNGGVPFVLISGMRTTTLFQRLPYLPRADAYVSESGGRIFYPHPISTDSENECDDVDGLVKGLIVRPVSYLGISPLDAAPFTLVEDMQWRDQISKQNAAGSDGYNNDTPIEQRQGKLWDFARALKKEGYVLDSSGYATAYRINQKQQTIPDLASKFDEFIDKCARKEGIPNELGCSTNLGCVDVYPSMSGKRNCAEYIIKRFLQGEGVSLKSHAYCLCDDDNDVEMALACSAAYLPSITSDSIQQLVSSPSQGGGKLVVTEDVTKGIVESLATEAALELILMKLIQMQQNTR